MAENGNSHTTPDPLVLDAQGAENWRKFIIQFEIFLVAKTKDEKPDKLKINLLLNCAGANAIEKFSHFVFNEGESRESYEVVSQKLDIVKNLTPRVLFWGRGSV